MYSIVYSNIDLDTYIPESSKELWKTWLATTPKYTYIRVNLLVSTVEQVLSLIKEYLTEEAVRKCVPMPAVTPHYSLPDCVVISPWTREAVLKPRPGVSEVIVDSACGAAVLRGANVFAPGVLGLPFAVQGGDVVDVFADSSSSCKRGLTVPFVHPGKVFVGHGVMKMSRKRLFEKDLHPRGVAVEMTESMSGVASVSLPHHLGVLQNLASIVCSHVLSPQPGDKVIDLCAAPGHKTTHLATLMKNQGVLVALDKMPRKVETMKALCLTMQADFVKAFCYDSTKAVSKCPGEHWAPPYCPDTFDHVLLDAPCSALGQRPQIGNKITDKQIASYPKLQKKLFASAVQLVKPLGTIVYSTCTLTVEENEKLVGWALRTYPQLRLVPAEPILGSAGIPQVSLSEEECVKVQRFTPSTKDDTIGFFIAKFFKVS